MGKNGALRCAHVKLPPIGGVDRHGKLHGTRRRFAAAFCAGSRNRFRSLRSLSLHLSGKSARRNSALSRTSAAQRRTIRDPGWGNAVRCHSGAAKRNPEPINTDMSGRGGPSCTFLERQRLPAPLARPGLTGGKRLEQWTATHGDSFSKSLVDILRWTRTAPRPVPTPMRCSTRRHPMWTSTSDVEPTARSSTRLRPNGADLEAKAACRLRRALGAAEVFELGRLANENPPRLRTYDAPGPGSTWSNSTPPIMRSCGRAWPTGFMPRPGTSRSRKETGAAEPWYGRRAFS